MRNHQKTVPLWKHQATLLLMGCVCFFLGMRVLTLEHEKSREVISPLAKFQPPVVLTKTEYRTQVKYELPETVEDEIHAVFGEKAGEAIKVFSCESGLRSVCNDGTNRNGTVDCGVPQINTAAHGINRKWLLEPGIAIRVAKKLYDEQGWGPWYSSRSCHGLL